MKKIVKVRDLPMKDWMHFEIETWKLRVRCLGSETQTCKMKITNVN